MTGPIYTIDEELNCGVIEYNNKTYLLDLKNYTKIINFNKNFIFTSNEDVYPSYIYNKHRINYLQFIYGFRENSNVDYYFKNGNKYDIRNCNVICYHKYNDFVKDKYNVIEYIPGHYSTNGVDPYSMKNPLWKIKENDKIYLLMYCEKDTLCKLCPDSYQKILDYEKNENNNNKLTFNKISNGYIVNTNNNKYIHQIITGCFGNGKGTKEISVDHIDGKTTNNCMENLRIATRKEQEQNCKGIKEDTKRERKHNAKPLPEGINQTMLKKHVVYYHEWLNPEKTRSREYFKIEKHPKLLKSYSGTKSNKIPILEKLKIINQILEDLDNDIYPS